MSRPWQVALIRPNDRRLVVQKFWSASAAESMKANLASCPALGRAVVEYVGSEELDDSPSIAMRASIHGSPVQIAEE